MCTEKYRIDLCSNNRKDDFAVSAMAVKDILFTIDMVRSFGVNWVLCDVRFQTTVFYWNGTISSHHLALD